MGEEADGEPDVTISILTVGRLIGRFEPSSNDLLDVNDEGDELRELRSIDGEVGLLLVIFAGESLDCCVYVS